MGPDASSKLSVGGDIAYSGSLKPSVKPIIIKRHKNLSHGINQTSMSLDYIASVIGFSAENGYIEEHDTQDVDIRVRMDKSSDNKTWTIDCQMATSNSGGEAWCVDVMYIDVRLVDDQRYS